MSVSFSVIFSDPKKYFPMSKIDIYRSIVCFIIVCYIHRCIDIINLSLYLVYLSFYLWRDVLKR